ncbi:MAG: DnaD domain protein [Oscillospiraceae bacterium]|nr:DnaD domain protein [Oscillospiraceae bacterium]
MDYKLNAGVWNKVFAVPTSVVDEYIKLAGGNSLKLLLFLLRHGGECFSDDELRDKLGFSKNGELEDAAVFWEQRGIIRRAYGDDSGELCAAKEKSPSITEVDIQTPSAAKTKALKPSSASSGEIADRIKNDKEIALLFSEAENLYGRPLRARELNVVISLVDHYGLNVGVSLMLLNYCVKAEKTTPEYIWTCAKDWADNGINSVELANARVLKLEQRDRLYDRLKTAMGLKSKLPKKTTDLVEVWSEQWGFSEEMIMHAYDETVYNIGSWKPEYMNTILENWKTNGIFTVEDAQKASENYKASKKQTSVPSKAKAKQKTVEKSSSSKSSFDVNDIMTQIRNSYRMDVDENDE